MSDKPRMLWVARDRDKSVWVYTKQPTLLNGVWDCPGHSWNLEFDSAIPDLARCECRMFVEFAPRVAVSGTLEEALQWEHDAWYRVLNYRQGDIILPMPPDPTPHLVPADPKAARRNEILAQIAALQEELAGMEG